jgi:hypothetical protein
MHVHPPHYSLYMALSTGVSTAQFCLTDFVYPVTMTIDTNTSSVFSVLVNQGTNQSGVLRYGYSWIPCDSDRLSGP